MMKKNIFSILLLILSLISCSGNQNQTPQTLSDSIPLPKDPLVFEGTGRKGGQIVLPIAGNPKTLNPILASDNVSSQVLEPVFCKLIDFNHETLKMEFDLARSLEVSADSLTYTIKIRRGLHWSDGTPFTVDDILFTYQVVVDPNILNSLKDILTQGDGSFPRLEKVDHETLRFTLAEPNALFEAILGDVDIIPKHKWQKIYEAGGFMQAMTIKTDPKDVVGMGPFLIDKIESDQRIVMRRNPYYHKIDKNGQRLPYAGKLVWIIAPDFNALLVKFQNGETDMHKVRAEEFDLLKRGEGQGGYTVYDLGPGLARYYFQVNFNPQKNKEGISYVEKKKLELFSDKRFRQALSYAIDREGIIKTAFHGRATPINTFFGPGQKLWHDPKLRKYPYDPEKARLLLKKMGLKDSNGDGYLEYHDGSLLKFSVKTNSENHTRIQIGNLLKEDFRKIGIRLVLEPVPFNNLLTSVKDSFDYDSVIMSWSGGVPPDPAMSKNVLLSSGRGHQWNPMQEKPETDWEKRIDELVAANERTTDFQKRLQSYNEIEKIWVEELPQITILQENESVAAKNHFGNVKPSSMFTYYVWNIEEIYDKTLK